MVLINAKVKAYTKNRTFTFQDGWDFEIADFKFTKISDHELEITFSFESKLEVDDELFGRVRESPHDLNEDLLKIENELDTLLDVLGLQLGAGIRIDLGSYEFNYPGGSNRSSFAAALSLSEHDAISERFERLKSANEPLIDALRFHRLSLLEEDSGEKTTQLWSVIERLYGKQPGGSFLDKDELSWLSERIDESEDISEDKKEKLIEGIKHINPINTLDLLADRIKLNTTDGPLSEDDKKDLLRGWKKLRGYQGHGEYLLRNENLQEELYDLADTVELILENNITPRMYMVVAFEDGVLSDGWKNTPSHEFENGWNFTPVRGSKIQEELRTLEHLVGEKGRVYIIDYKDIFKVELRASEKCADSEVEEPVLAYAKRVQEKMSAEVTENG